MDLPLYHVDAFVTDRPFSGSGAAVVPLDAWIDEALMQGIAAQNNLSETAFVVPESGGYRIRWFTPTMEVDLCGHATLASACVLFDRRNHHGDTVEFRSVSGELPVHRTSRGLSLDFPSRPAAIVSERLTEQERIHNAMGARPSLILKAARDWLLVFEDTFAVRQLQPDFAALAHFTGQGFIVTAPGENSDFVFRYFAPALGLNEDPATGSVQCTLVPYWAGRIGRRSLRAIQASARGAEFQLELSPSGDRVLIGGRCRPYLEGTIHV